MTRDELIEAIRELRNNAGPSDPQDSTDRDLGYWEAAVDILELAHRLDSTPAMAWQKEPDLAHKDGKRHAYLILMHGATDVRWHGEQWEWLVYFDPSELAAVPQWRPLNGRRVCPIPAPLPLPKRGDK